MTPDLMQAHQNALNARLNLEKLRCEKSLAQFVRSSWHIIEPGTKLEWNWHIDTMCGYLEAVYAGKITRLIINVPPGAMKSTIVSVMYPAWIWAKDPTRRYLVATNAEELALRDATKMKDIISSSWFQRNWPVGLKASQNEKGYYVVDTHLGSRQSIGFGSNATGKRGDMLIIDDPIDAAKAGNSELTRNSVNYFFDKSLSSRLNDMNTNPIIIIMQRLHEDDLCGHVQKFIKRKWVTLAIPMLYREEKTFDAKAEIDRPELNDPRTKKGELLFSGKFSKATVEEQIEILGSAMFAAQHQQTPVPDGGGIIKNNWWRIWPDDVPLPNIDHQFLSLDTAFSEADSKAAAYSAMTRWGVFKHWQRDQFCLMLLGRWYGRVGYDELRRMAKEWDNQYKPDSILIEKKATGISLVQDLRRAIPTKIRTYTPGQGMMTGYRNEDKVSRAYSISPMFESGLIYIPAKSWTDEFIKMIASFPNGAPPSADLTDTVTQACVYLRNMHWVTHPDDAIETKKVQKKADWWDNDKKADTLIY